jgi:hypothetical protein
MSAINPHRGEVEFDLFVGQEGYSQIGPGDVYLRFTNDDLARICGEHGVENPRDLAVKIEGGAIKVAQSCLFYGLKTRLGGTAERRWQPNAKFTEDTPFAIGVATAKIGDALTWNILGKTGAQLLQEYLEQQKAAKTAEAEEAAPFASSSGSSRKASGPDYLS